MSARGLTEDERLARVERVVALLAADRYGAPGLGPMDPGWRAARERAKADLAAIIAEANEAPIETRAG